MSRSPRGGGGVQVMERGRGQDWAGTVHPDQLPSSPSWPIRAWETNTPRAAPLQGGAYPIPGSYLQLECQPHSSDPGHLSTSHRCFVIKTSMVVKSESS